MHILIVATRNVNKLKEIKEIFSSLNLEIKSLLDYPNIPDILEDGRTFEENALKKARKVFEFTQLPTLSDDSGLEVFALHMEPGVHSAVYAGEPKNYALNNEKLLLEMKNIPDNQRVARFRCVTVFKTNSKEIITEGSCKGRILSELKGDGGFGYDPLFIPDGYSVTFAELPSSTKNQISHRGIALKKLIPEILNHYKDFA